MIASPVARRLSSAGLAFGLAVILLAGPLAPKASAASALPLLDTTFATLLNTLRTTLGLGSLAVDPQLSNVALGWSRTMASSGDLAHNPAVRSQVSGWSKLGENVGYGNAVTQIFDALVASPAHMRNMSDGDFTRVGVATVSDATGRLWSTHVFMRPGGPVAAPAAAAQGTDADRRARTSHARAARPAPTTAAPTTAPPTTAPATTTAPVPTTLASAPASVAVASQSGATEATLPTVAAAAHRAGPSSGGRVSASLLADAALLTLLVLGAAALVVVRRSAGHHA